MKAYRSLPIAECGEPLVAIPNDFFLLTTPHPYAAFGAPYGDNTPWVVRKSVLQALHHARTELIRQRPGWRIRIFDAYRPNAVQAFMVRHEFIQLAGGRPPEAVHDATERVSLWERTYRIWAEPSADPATPPPHSTGAALDLTLTNADDQDIPMGSPIDENSDRSNPDYFANRDPAIHANRQCLLYVMQTAGFRRHAFEWWHFSLGDQMWAWSIREDDPHSTAMARYGRADLF